MLVVNSYPSVKALLSVPFPGDRYVTTGEIVPANIEVEHDARIAKITKAKRFTIPPDCLKCARYPRVPVRQGTSIPRHIEFVGFMRFMVYVTGMVLAREFPKRCRLNRGLWSVRRIKSAKKCLASWHFYSHEQFEPERMHCSNECLLENGYRRFA